jgi:AraC-like DNA-binding protein
MKQILVKLLLLVLCFGFTNVVTEAKDYIDLPEDHWAYKQIQILTDFNVVVGYPDGYYRPEQLVTRAEFASIVVKAFDQEFAKIVNPVSFSDVTEEDWFWGVVQRAAMFNLLKGYPDGKFNPYGTVTRGHAIATTVNALTTATVTNQKATEILDKQPYIRVSDLAQKVGYSNVNSFIRNFKKLKHIPPGEYKKLP